MPDTHNVSGSAHRGVLVIGTIAAACASLAVHAFMLERLHVPYPFRFPKSGPATWPEWLLLAFAGIRIHLLLKQSRPGWGLAFRGLMVFLILAGLRESLVRAWLMNMINGNPPTIFPILQDGLPKWLLLGCASIGCAAAASVVDRPLVRAGIAREIAAACVVGTGIAAMSFLLDETWGQWLERFAFLDTPSRWNPPYDWHILLPAYVTAIEPAIAGTALGLLTWHALPRSRGRFWWLVLLMVLVEGHLVEPFLNIFYARGGAAIAIVSVGQFTLDGIALAILVAAALEMASFVGKRSPGWEGQT